MDGEHIESVGIKPGGSCLNIDMYGRVDMWRDSAVAVGRGDQRGLTR